MVEDKLNEKLYEIVLKEPVLSTKVLKDNGINSNDINKLIEQEELVRVKRGYYALPNVDKLFYYAKGLNYQKKYEEAHDYFLKCYELNPLHGGTCFQLFFWDINHEKYDSSIKWMMPLFESGNKYYVNDAKYYLYLLSFIIDLPKELQKIVKKNSSSDFIVYYEDKRYTLHKEQSKSRSFAYSQNFSAALKVLKSIIEKNSKANQHEMLTKKLLNAVIQEKKEQVDRRVEYIKNKNYEELINDLRQESFNHDLSRANKYLLEIFQDCVDIKNTSKVPLSIKMIKSQIFDKDAIFYALDTKNYKLALKLSARYLENREVNTPTLLHLAIGEIVELIEDIEKKQEKNRETGNIQLKTVTPKKKELPVEVDASSTFSDVVQCLLQQDVDSAYIKLHSYLKSINKEQYEFLLIDLIKISALENDKIFSKPMMALTYISKDNFKFEIDSYVQSFYESLAKHELNKAKVYLDILSKARDIGYEFNAADLLNQVLDSNFEMSDVNSNSKIEENKKEEQQEVVNKKQNIEKKEPLHIPSTTTISKNDPIFEFVQGKLTVLKENKGILLSKLMQKSQRKKIYKIVYDIPEMSAFSIGEGESKRIVLRYVDPSLEIDKKETMLKANELYRDKKYKKALDELQKLMMVGYPPHYVYSKIGLCYLRLNNKKEAVKYLTVGSELAKEAKSPYDYTEFIMQITGVIPEDEQKSYVKMNINDFENSNNEYGIDNLNLITSYMFDNNLDIDKACLELGLTNEQTNIVKVMFVRKCYTDDKYDKGDQILKQVEKSEDKSPLVKSLFTETIKNKRFYRNRKVD